jgi:hypothetical protein
MRARDLIPRLRFGLSKSKSRALALNIGKEHCMRRFVTVLMLTFAFSLVAGCFNRSTEPVSGQDKKSRLGQETKNSGDKGGKGKPTSGGKGGIPAE